MRFQAVGKGQRVPLWSDTGRTLLRENFVNIRTRHSTHTDIVDIGAIISCG